MELKAAVEITVWSKGPERGKKVVFQKGCKVCLCVFT